MTIQQVVNCIVAGLAPTQPGAGWDTFKAGDPQQPARGVVVTFTATRAVLRRAVELKANLVITHEPTFYQDEQQEPLQGDDVYESKRRFIREQGLTIWRCHDLLHARRPDGILEGMARKLGWSACQRADCQELFDLPATTLGQLAESVKSRLGVPSLRMIGQSSWPVARVALSCGCPWWSTHRQLLGQPGVDALVCGELREWETCEYVRDAVAAGRRQGLIVLGHCNSEEGGMEWLADWLRDRVDGVKVEFVPAGDPFRYV